MDAAARRQAAYARRRRLGRVVIAIEVTPEDLIAAALRECGREYDTIARYGGDVSAFVPKAVAAHDRDQLYRVIIELRSFDTLLGFRYG